jgi:hypothetical protein
LALPAGAAELVLQVISERNERASMIVTTNLPFGEWTKVFPDARLAKAVVDRLTHRAHIIDTGQESWRFRHGLARANKKGAARPPPTDGVPHQARSTTHINQRGVGPLQASTPGPLRTSTPIANRSAVSSSLEASPGASNERRTQWLTWTRFDSAIVRCARPSGKRVALTPEGIEQSEHGEVGKKRSSRPSAQPSSGRRRASEIERTAPSLNAERASLGVCPERRNLHLLPSTRYWRNLVEGVASNLRAGCKAWVKHCSSAPNELAPGT